MKRDKLCDLVVEGDGALSSPVENFLAPGGARAARAACLSGVQLNGKVNPIADQY